MQLVLFLLLPGFIASTMLARYLQAAGMHALVVRLSLLSTLVNAAGDFAFAALFDLRGVALATVFGYLTSATVLLLACRQLRDTGERRGVARLLIGASAQADAAQAEDEEQLRR